jgi:hypothetical protein
MWAPLKKDDNEEWVDHRPEYRRIDFSPEGVFPGVPLRNFRACGCRSDAASERLPRRWTETFEWSTCKHEESSLPSN